MKYNDRDKRHFQRLLSAFASRPELSPMRRTPQHKGHTSYAHCVDVAAMSFKLARGLRLPVDIESLIHGAMLHHYVPKYREKYKAGHGRLRSMAPVADIAEQ